MSKDALLAKIKAHEATIGVIGLGYVGLPLILRFGEERFHVLGFDVDETKVTQLNAGKSYIQHIDAQRIQHLRNEKRFEATTEFGRLAEADCIIICVPTPLTAKKILIFNTSKKRRNRCRRHCVQGQLISLESTTYPGTTDEILLDKFRKTGLEVGRDYFLVFLARTRRSRQSEVLDPHDSQSRRRHNAGVPGAGRRYFTNRSSIESYRFHQPVPPN